MKIPVDHIDLGAALNYPDYWIEVPRSVKEGYLHEFTRLGAGQDAGDPNADVARQTNVKIMELITAWNLDDDGGKVLPLISKCKTDAERSKVVAEIPVDIIVFVANRIAGNVAVPEATKDF